MTESKLKRIVVATTVGAVLLLVVLISVMVYQLISIRVRRNQIAELEAQIKGYERLIEQGEETNEIRKMRWWIERRARELGYQYVTDIDLP